ncbi:MAG: GTPase ObgE [Clostridium sp.]|nr:GTPase ObgE [Clostridium sp.]MCM1444497.1 GTPase ObgE [Candidatus Amulumruptor caecigallinarius]
MFVDEVIVALEAGSGGNGCMAFRREKFVEMGGPFGGNGGKGADIIFKVDEGLNTLLDLRYKKLIRGDKGENGLGKGMHGKNAEDVVISVPPGTIVTDIDTGLVIADLVDKESKAIIAKGGRGGRGNIAFKTQSNPAPNFAENGEPGEIRKVKVELKLLADVGLVGMPSVGKSTLISKISSARPKIASYHFTTLSPNLGVVGASNNRSFVVADLPGLIEGASLGHGLGHQFLRHIERTRVIAHIIDMSGAMGTDPYEDYITINNELKSYNESLLEKPQIVIANKMDMPLSNENLKEFKSRVNVDVYEISAINGDGINKIINVLADMLDNIPKKSIIKENQYENHVLYKFEEKEPFTIIKENNAWLIKGERVEKLLKMTKFSSDEAVLRFSNRLMKMGVDDKLRELGAKEGDTIRILDFEFEYRL